MNRDKWSSLFWLIGGILICVGSVRLSLGTLHNPGPGFLPFCIGAFLGILSFILHLQSRRTAPADGAVLWADQSKALKVFLTVLALLVFAVMMESLGFLLSTILFLGFLLRMVSPQRWSIVIGGSLLVSTLSYCVFELWLKADLPKGFFQYF
jgi:putative tricarboxylic transport membrane protein